MVTYSAFIRGVEFPGGKAEQGETIEEAAIRETIEETGVTITDTIQFAEYVVRSTSTFCKAVFTGKVAEIDEHPALYETEGAIWMTSEELDQCEELSFLMKNTGMETLRKWVKENESVTVRLFIEDPIRPQTRMFCLEEITYWSDGLKVKGLMAEPITEGTYEGIIYLRGGMQHIGMVRPARIAQFASQGFVVFAPYYRGNRGGEGRDEFAGADR